MQSPDVTMRVNETATLNLSLVKRMSSIIVSLKYLTHMRFHVK